MHEAAFVCRYFLSLALALAQVAFAETLKKPEMDEFILAERPRRRRFSRIPGGGRQGRPQAQASVAAYENRRRWQATTWSTSPACSACTTACTTRRP